MVCFKVGPKYALALAHSSDRKVVRRGHETLGVLLMSDMSWSQVLINLSPFGHEVIFALVSSLVPLKGIENDDFELLVKIVRSDRDISAVRI